MAQKNIADYSTEELLKSKKTLTAILGVVAGLGIVIIGYLVYAIVTKQELGIALTISPVGLGVASLPSAMQIGAINKELKRRAA